MWWVVSLEHQAQLLTTKSIFAQSIKIQSQINNNYKLEIQFEDVMIV